MWYWHWCTVALFSGLLQVVRGDFIIFFNKIFDALCKLSADSDANVQSAAHLLDRLVKVWTVFSYTWVVFLFNTLCWIELIPCKAGYCDGKWSVQVCLVSFFCLCIKNKSVTINFTWLSIFLGFGFLQYWGIHTSFKRAHERSKPLCSAISGRMDHCSW